VVLIPGRRTAFRQFTLVTVACAILGGCSGRTASPTTIAVLTCRDSAGQQALDPGTRPVNGVAVSQGSTDILGAGAQNVWQSRAGQRYLALKVFLAVAPGARPGRTVTVLSPPSARLFYAAAARWGSIQPGPVPVVPGLLRRSVRLSACGHKYAGYVGGIFVRRGTCVTLAVSAPAMAASKIAVPVSGPCRG
jgi:hypothetical protein